MHPETARIVIFVQPFGTEQFQQANNCISQLGVPITDTGVLRWDSGVHPDCPDAGDVNAVATAWSRASQMGNRVGLVIVDDPSYGGIDWLSTLTRSIVLPRDKKLLAKCKKLLAKRDEENDRILGRIPEDRRYGS